MFEDVFTLEAPPHKRSFGKPSPLGQGFKHINRLPEVTQQCVRKLQKQKMRFNWSASQSAVGKMWVKEQIDKNLKRSEYREAVIHQITYALSGINLTQEPQYHPPYNLQSTGRMHTSGGFMGFPRWYRKQFMLPADPNNVLVEVDGIAMQLLILSDILGLYEHKQYLLDIIDREGTIWGHIGPSGMKKQIKKPIVYSFCYGCSKERIAGMVARDNPSLAGRINQKTVEACLGGEILRPFVETREQWMEQYTIDRIRAGEVKARHYNALGMALNLNDKLEQEQKALQKEIERKEKKQQRAKERIPTAEQRVRQARTTANEELIRREEKELANLRRQAKGNFKRELDQHEVAKSLLAHLAQGKEQEIMQTTIIEAIDPGININLFQYDGIVVEMPRERVDGWLGRMQQWIAQRYPDVRLDAKILSDYQQPL